MQLQRSSPRPSSTGQWSATKSMMGSSGLPRATTSAGEGVVVGDAYGRQVYLSNGRVDGERSQKKKKLATQRIESQNVRGFVEESRRRWMGAWRRTPVRERPAAWIIQETHVSSQEEADQLEADWTRMWGKHKMKGGPRLSYWSIHSQKTGGVAILLNPDVAGKVMPWEQDRWSNRSIAVTLENTILMNIYAPNQHRDREEFFAEIAKWNWPAKDAILAGDFNSVQSPLLDRMGGTRQPGPESNALKQLLETRGMEDARSLAESGEEDPGAPEAIDYYTYWGPETASRIDRFYVPRGWTARVQLVEVKEPLVSSDHQRLCLHMQSGEQRVGKTRRRRGAVYPIRAANQERVQAQLMAELIEAGVGSDTTAKAWDSTVLTCGDCIQRVARREVKNRKAAKHRLNAQDRAHLVTRRDLLQVDEDDLHEELLVRMGQNLERTMDQLRWSYKRVSNWERDQSIAEIAHINGKPFARGMNIAEKFKSEWQPVLGKVHSEVEIPDMEQHFDRFVTIPQTRRISEAQNAELMKSISEDEVITAIAALNRHKAAGPDGLNNDFFKDIQPILIPAMVAIGNELLKGADPPASFLEGLIIPLRKKGDSTDAMNFRPISLLQTGYKVYTKVIAIRMQTLLGTPIGDSQQGFVHGRQMMKTVMMMLAMLATASQEPELAAALSRLILLLDFRKAYDTVSREFLFLALIKFGFSPEFVEMIQKLHDGTTARFLVNGELSEPMEVVTGIRQGCPLAPLLFIIAAEVLALAIQQDTQSQGIRVPGGDSTQHKFSAFVDDSTVFLQQAKQLPRVMELVEQFGKLSGLHVQPAKSHIIFLNTAVRLGTYEGIPVLKSGDTVRYLGYAVGTGALTDINWANRIRAVQRRLATATQLATSVDNRATLLNVIMMPSLLFTAAVFNMPSWAEKQLRNLQKQFLWRHSTSTDTSKHKMNPGLVYAPKQAGGLGLASIPLACKTQRMKHTILWLIQRKDVYYAAWRSWMFRGEQWAWTQAIPPREERRRGQHRKGLSPGDELQQLVGEWNQPTEEVDAEEMQQYSQDLERTANEAMSWTVDDEWLVELQQELRQPRLVMTPEDQRFWPTFTWEENPWIRDKEGRKLTARKFHRIKPCSIEELQITRIGRATYSFRIPRTGEASHGQVKLQRWGIAILMNAPALAEGETLQVDEDVQMRHSPPLQGNYSWKVDPNGNVTGTATMADTGNVQVIELKQQPNGVHWVVQEPSVDHEESRQDRQQLQRRQAEGSIVFLAHPRCHSFAWRVKDTVANKHVLKAIKQQPFNKYKRETRQLAKQIEGLGKVARTSAWQASVMKQTPTQLWAHKNELTEYQVWVGYRIAVRQLNLFHADRVKDDSCRKLQECSTTKETMEHIFWSCPCAAQCWLKLIQHWTGQSWQSTAIQRFIGHCAARTAPSITETTMKRIKTAYPDTVQAYIIEWKRMWRILSSICVTTLWIQRNGVVFENEEVTSEATADRFWATGMRQLRAIGKRERRNPEKQVQGTRLLLCQRMLEHRPKEKPPQVASLVQPPDLTQAPALLTRLRNYQTSSRL